ncbi:BlaI/MecI/CopY family transcriptional regulator [Paenibacillus macerans]|uniref:BlaI/MecI/CopY family transcriptional regulator n=1 Tax=Paenibacillus macerans TaxID=44252 RepID=UPI002041AE0F|nr:BlaI/MecI/CopY family transcriptional regulator [Paenibacillus macerans]MCM3697841.1 BlaI/MecI/CopY family transcriptional regulator [Paenibacillus macerans]
MRKKVQSISPSELVVMKVLWKESRCTASVIIDQVSKEAEWHFRTIKTLLRNLVRKQFVGFKVDEHDSRIYYYFPLIEEEAYLRQERQQFLDMYYNGNRHSLLAGFLQDGRLSPREAEMLKRLLSQNDESRGDERP